MAVNLLSKIRTRFRHRKFRWMVYLTVLLVVFYFSLPKPLFQDPLSTIVLDADGKLIGAKIAADGQWRFPGENALPAKYVTCLLKFEDRHFYQHPGVNPVSISKALSRNIRQGHVVNGGSTITMQVIRLSRKGQSRTYLEKLLEMYLAIRVECAYSKDEILGMYARYAPFGGNVVGLEAAAWRYFKRKPMDLSWAEAATLAVLPNAPSLMYPGKNMHSLQAKRNKLLSMLYLDGDIDQSTYELSLLEELPEAPNPLPELAPHLMQSLIRKHGDGRAFHTTISSELQTAVLELAVSKSAQWQSNGVFNASALVVRVSDGAVIAYMGNLPGSPGSRGTYNDLVRAERSSGSILKPFLYAGMLQQGLVFPNSLVADVPSSFGGYAPKNYARKFAGAVEARKAIARSLNVPAVRMLQRFGVGKFYMLLQRLGMKTLHKTPGHYGLSLILGGAEVRLWDICSMYSKLAKQLQSSASQASWKEITTEQASRTADDEHRDSVLNDAVIYEMFEAMSEVNRPEAQTGWMDFLSRQKIAWKTGTSFGQRDAWAVGVTPGYVVGVWVGNASGEGKPLLTGIEAAGPLLFDIFSLLPKSAWFTAPDKELVEINRCKFSGDRAGDLCDDVVLTQVPKTCLPAGICRFHKVVYIDVSSGLRAHGACSDQEQLQARNWFVLPPLMEHYYKLEHPEYLSLPAWKPGCLPENDVPVMAFIAPAPQAEITIPRTFDGSPTSYVAEITHIHPETRVFWFLDGKMLSSTRTFHQQAIQAEPGEHELFVVDELGNELSRKFRLLD